MKNLSVLTDFLGENIQRFDGKLRRIVVGEFGLSGKPNETEELQAAAYLYAYFTVYHNDADEALIWHRHVDHAGEMDLYYGLFAASELLLEPTAPKTIHSVFTAVDSDTLANRRLIDSLIHHLPGITRAELYGGETIPTSRVTFFVTKDDGARSPFRERSEILFDFSKSLYHFYPTDNTAYLEHYDDNGARFLRAKLIPVSSKEYMGIACSLSDTALLRDASSITLRLRASVPEDIADLRLLLLGADSGTDIILDGATSITCGDWVEVTFPLNGFTDEELDSCVMKIWLRSSASTDGDLFLDLASVSLNFTHGLGKTAGFFLLMLGIAALALLIYIPILIVSSVKRRKAHIGSLPRIG
jgi:hypothetical protein